VFHSAHLNARAELRLSLETKLRQALGTSQLALHFQPKFDTRTLALSGMEALLRWEHPELGFVSPAQFIPIAEETSLILPLGDWVLRTACEQLTAWQRMGLGKFSCAVNLSVAQFRDRELPQRIARIIADTGIAPSQLEFELTESVIMHDEAVTNHMLAELRHLGVTLAIDDFGTGYSSLGYLKRLPVNTVKIDRSFVQGLHDGSDDRRSWKPSSRWRTACALRWLPKVLSKHHNSNCCSVTAASLCRAFCLPAPWPRPLLRAG